MLSKAAGPFGYLSELCKCAERRCSVRHARAARQVCRQSHVQHALYPTPACHALTPCLSLFASVTLLRGSSCLQLGVRCGDLCKCVDCHNCGEIDGTSLPMPTAMLQHPTMLPASAGQQQRMQHAVAAAAAAGGAYWPMGQALPSVSAGAVTPSTSVSLAQAQAQAQCECLLCFVFCFWVTGGRCPHWLTTLTTAAVL
jgi:hypothetical protein